MAKNLFLVWVTKMPHFSSYISEQDVKTTGETSSHPSSSTKLDILIAFS
jgi:hypothetical protein